MCDLVCIGLHAQHRNRHSQRRKELIVLTIQERGGVVVRDVLAYEKLLDHLEERQPARSVWGSSRSAGGCS